MNHEKLGTGKIISISLMLFAMFFGAGNMIFPPMLGYLGGENFFQGTLGFVVTDAGLSILGIAAIVLVGTKLDDLASLVGPKFSIFVGMTIYLLIGPLFALPRTGTVSYEIAAIPFLGEGAGIVSSVVFTALFFGITFILCLNPSRIVDIVGKVLTPILLISIAVIFIVSVINPVGQIGAPKGEYAEMPFFKGMVEGYLALDGLAALAFAIVVINAIRDMGVTESKSIVRYTLMAGILAGIGLGVVYLALGFVGAQTSMEDGVYGNGGQILASVVYRLLGTGGNAVLGLAVLLACLTTSIGLATSFSDYFHEIFPKLSYRAILTSVCVFSFAISNVGLTTMITFTLPALVMVYPPAITLVLLSFAKKFIGRKHEAYALGMLFAFVIGVFDGLKTAGISTGSMGDLVAKLPFFDLGVGWILPAIVGCLIGMLPFINFLSKHNVKQKQTPADIQ
ncbi:branched-chain amino acid transport system II carrier protein [Emergencia timonensis]|uniref:branched-chain amino acid transport system II carrier protein n=1 Tax=Emergencia timonensis TaxID=1776384 RepID=UPI001D0684BF|nr:branched-chain amino acid transport system II carrier protein [Emergencia timonensis]MCB6476167.1 branched-chain amino acid transport system II carrier protein [Emergencia timonensis]BDF08275.1 branched-chain amino acid transport system carrier protein [Emergencia timonensis]BDF12363.1 branched-chain amino acid transport system carrier protein [Emergencia timonensis]